MVEKQWRLKKKQSKQAKGIKKNWGVWHVKEGELVVNVSKWFEGEKMAVEQWSQWIESCNTWIAMIFPYTTIRIVNKL